MTQTQRLNIKRKPRVRQHAQRRLYRPFPYHKVARMWEKQMTIAQIAHAIDRVDKHNPKDPYHSLRNFLHRMHHGYVNGHGRSVKLPYRVSTKALQSARRAGLRAW